MAMRRAIGAAWAAGVDCDFTSYPIVETDQSRCGQNLRDSRFSPPWSTAGLALSSTTSRAFERYPVSLWIGQRAWR
jgi:hypothetical protein